MDIPLAVVCENILWITQNRRNSEANTFKTLPSFSTNIAISGKGFVPKAIQQKNKVNNVASVFLQAIAKSLAN